MQDWQAKQKTIRAWRPQNPKLPKKHLQHKPQQHQQQQYNTSREHVHD